MDRDLLESARNGTGRRGKTFLINYLTGKRLTQRQSIAAKYYDCDGMGSSGECDICACALYPYSPYGGLSVESNVEAIPEPKQAILKDINEAPRRRVPLQVPVAVLLITGLLLGVSVCFASICHAYTDEQIVNAIYKAEGGKKAQYAYGIRSVSYKDDAEARKICFNTVRNNRTRFTNQSKYTDYLEFLASRYCPTQGKNLTEREKRVNIYWLKNVRFFLEKGVIDG